MSVLHSLDCFLHDSMKTEGIHLDNASYVMTSGLQELLTAMIGLCCAKFTDINNCPPGFTGMFIQSFTKPSLGGLHKLLLWCLEQGIDPSNCGFSNILNKSGKRGTSWLQNMIELRNRWAHPKDDSPETIIKQVLIQLKESPDFSSYGSFSIVDDNVSWLTGEETYSLAPFFWIEKSDLRVFTTFESPNRLLFHEDEVPAQIRFTEVWKQWRMTDINLVKPSIDEFHERVKGLVATYSAEPPWWIEKAFNKDIFGVLIDSGLLDGVLANVESIWPETSIIDLTLSKAEKPFELVASKFGLAGPPTNDDFLGLIRTSNPICLGIRTQNLESKSFLGLLFWLADLHDLIPDNHCRIFVERSIEQIKKDAEALWDRLPDLLTQILSPPPDKPKAHQLPELVWGGKRKKIMGFL